MSQQPAAKPKTAITPTRQDDYPEWYLQVIKHADLAENSPVRGCMVIKPWGMSIWDRIRTDLDARIQEHGAENAYFPLLIPKSFLSKEAEHVDGFAKECAVVTHHRLTVSPDGKYLVAGVGKKDERGAVVDDESDDESSSLGRAHRAFRSSVSK